MPDWDMHYDRRVSDDFLAHFLPGRVGERLVEYARFAAYPLDLQMRRNPKTGAEHASLYLGLTTILDLHGKKNGLGLSANKAFSEGSFGFDASWSTPRPTNKQDSAWWRRVEDYIEAVIPFALEKYAGKEGPVQSAASVFAGRDRTMVDREVALHFRDQVTKDRIMAEVTQPFVDAVAGVTGVPGKKPTSFGGECDLLALDAEGRLLAVEIKPRDVSTITWACAQASVYAGLLERWVATPAKGTDRPVTILRGMLDQRARLGLAPVNRPGLPEQPTVVPVVGVARGTSQKSLDLLRSVQEQLIAAGCGNERLEVWEISLSGRPDRLF